jgi:exonuclease I
MARRKVLVPYNFTDYDGKALDFVIQRFADDESIEVTLFNAYVPVPKIELRNSPIMEKISQNLAFLQQKIHAQEAEIKKAIQKLLQNGFSKDRVNYIFRAIKKDVAQDIIDLAMDNGFDVVILNRNPAKITRFFTRSVSNIVINTLKKIEVDVVA